jgi:hypothetical protein
LIDKQGCSEFRTRKTFAACQGAFFGRGKKYQLTFRDTSGLRLIGFRTCRFLEQEFLSSPTFAESWQSRQPEILWRLGCERHLAGHTVNTLLTPMANLVQSFAICTTCHFAFHKQRQH